MLVRRFYASPVSQRSLNGYTSGTKMNVKLLSFQSDVAFFKLLFTAMNAKHGLNLFNPHKLVDLVTSDK